MQSWYSQINKPSWAPPETLFGQVWSVLYPMIFVANAIVLVLLAQGKISWKIALLFWVNLGLNLAFSVMQFGLRNQILASIDIILVFITTIACMVAIWPHAKIVSFLFFPYAVWLLIASVLQLSIAYLNR